MAASKVGDANAGRRRDARLDDSRRSVARDGTVYVIAPLDGEAARRILAIQHEFDPRSAREWTPHVTLAGSSGMGPISPAVTRDELQRALAPVAEESPPLSLPFGAPVRFMQSDVVVLPLDPHGPLRELHERIKSSGLPYAQPRFAFTPHATLSFYPQLTRQRAAKLLAMRIEEPAVITRLEVHHMGRDRRGKLLASFDLRGRG
jgi:2'-5' RNA ligase